MARADSTASERVLAKVADSTGRDVLDLPPLYDYVDPDALDAVVATATNGTVRFAYEGHEVAVESDGTIRLAERSNPTPRAVVESDD